ncbi:hypothetical protein IAU60_003178 [Kwoniella sp. DSM 27419]
MPDLKPYQRHLVQFGHAEPPHHVTVLSALRKLLRLGFNFPISLAIAMGLPLICNGVFGYFRPVRAAGLPPSALRSQLEHAKVDRPDYTLREVLGLYSPNPRLIPRAIDLGHIASFWAMAADPSGRVHASDLKRFQTGDWTEAVEKRRSSRAHGDRIPFWRGGPLLVAPHSWAVRTLFGVRVYE